MSHRSNELYEFGPFRLDPAERLLLRDRGPVTLTPKAFDLLVVLVSHAGRLVTREEILNQVWADAVVEEGNLSYTVSLLRKALGDDGEGPRYVETVPKLGYRFVAPVTELGGGPAGEVPAPAVAPTPSSASSRGVPSWLWAVAAGLLVILGGLAARLVSPGASESPAPRAMARFEVTLPNGFLLSQQGGPAISPDGRRLALVGTKGGRRQLWVRPMAADTLVALPGTEGATRPFWSPDSRRIGFFNDGRLQTVEASGGAVQTLCEAAFPATGTWGREGDILFSHSDGRLHRVSERGGLPAPVTALDLSRNEYAHRYPHFLPDGRRFLFNAVGIDSIDISMGALGSSALSRLYQGGAGPAFAAGHLLFRQQGALAAVQFDPDVGNVTSRATPLTSSFPGAYSVSDTGTIVGRYHSPLTEMAWYEGTGGRSRLSPAADRHQQVDISPGGTRVVVQRADETGRRALWLVDLTTGTSSRLTAGPRVAADEDTTPEGLDRVRAMNTPTDPAWSPDERAIAFSAYQRVFTIDLDSGRERMLVDYPERIVVDDWTPDGKHIVVRTSGRAVFRVSVGPEPQIEELLDTPYIEDQLQVSPDGRWVAYNTIESGEWEVYVSRFPSFAEKRQVSPKGGVQPRWGSDGNALHFLTEDGTMMLVDFTPTSGAASSARALFQTRLGPHPGISQYDVTADGRFLVIEPIGPPSLTVLTDWVAGVATQ